MTSAAAFFTGDHNAWCVVTRPATGEAVSDATPFLFTRNLGFGDPPGPPWEGATIADISGIIPDAEPFGGKMAVVVSFGGAVKILPREVATQAIINPGGSDLPFLSP